MKYLLRMWMVWIILATTAAIGQQKLPPLIDREIFFGDPEISGAQLSPDGTFLSFIKPYQGTRNIWVKKREEPFANARPLTADMSRPIRNYFWSHDSRYILYSQDKGGDENFNIYAVNPSQLLQPDQDVPESRDLTHIKGARVLIYDVPESDPDLLLIGLNDRDPSWHDLYQLKLSTGEKTLLRKNTEKIAGWVFDHKAQLRLAMRVSPNGTSEVLRVDDTGFIKIYETNVLETAYPLRFDQTNTLVYLVTNKGEENNFSQLMLLNPANGKTQLVEEDPLKRTDFGNAYFSEVSKKLIATVYEDQRQRIYWKDKSLEADYLLLKQKLPQKELMFGSSTQDERYWLISAASDVDPGATYLFDRQTKKLNFQYRPRPQLPVQSLASMQSVTYPSSDGMLIPAYLTLPKGAVAKNLPVMIVPHGGPWARDSWGYNSQAQFLANRGYAVLQPNFRGSTGYGKKFLNAGNQQWGDRMQDDITWGVKYLISKGIADPKRVGIMGGSYGGYATLAGVTYTPDLYAAAVAQVAPSNLLTLLSSLPPYWEAGRIIFHTRMGDPTTPEGKDKLKRQSPLNHADKITTPLMVVQGANDPRVKKAEADQIVAALYDRNYPVEYLLAPDEGHGFARPVNNMAYLAAAEKFLAKHLHGRYQESMSPAVAKRLKEITVDVETVIMPPSLDVIGNKATVPMPSKELKPGMYTYKVMMDMAGQQTEMTKSTEISAGETTWKILEKVQSPMGEISDESEVAKKTLLPSKRITKQAGAMVELAYTSSQISGSMQMAGNTKAIQTDLETPVFADGGAAQILAMLPLTENYQTSFQNFDMLTQQVKTMVLKVTGTEKITVPAGSFDTYKVEVKPANGDAGGFTFWVTKDSMVVKETTIIPQMNATVTAELR